MLKAVVLVVLVGLAACLVAIVSMGFLGRKRSGTADKVGSVPLIGHRIAALRHEGPVRYSVWKNYRAVNADVCGKTSLAWINDYCRSREDGEELLPLVSAIDRTPWVQNVAAPGDARFSGGDYSATSRIRANGEQIGTLRVYYRQADGVFLLELFGDCRLLKPPTEGEVRGNVPAPEHAAVPGSNASKKKDRSEEASK